MAINKRAHIFSQFKEWVESLTSDGGEMLYRGLPLIKHDLNSSIARRIINTPEEKPEKKPSYLDIWKVTSALIDDAKMQGYDLDHTRRGETPTTDFEILALLQHHYAATPLMDFSHNPFIALWFACQSNPDKQNNLDKIGKVIAVDPNKFQENLNEINNKINIKTDSITREGIKRIDENGEKTLLTENILWRFNPPGFDARILAQNSEFILGKTELGKNDIHGTCFISQNVKKNIQQKLDSYGISEERLFRDSSGFSRLNSQESPIKNLDQILADEESAEQQKQQKQQKLADFIRRITPSPPLPGDSES